MKKNYIVLGLFAISSAYGFSQPVVNPFPKKKVPKAAIQVVYSQYLQDGNHSAITGGIGTEKLQVYAPEIIMGIGSDSLNSYSIDAGVDVISSASMDNIDFVVSSASRVSKRAYLSVDYDRTMRKDRNTTLGAKAYASLESAYNSFGGAISYNHSSKDQSTAFSGEFEAYFDDLRWGRYNGVSPLQLVYPSELRYYKWFQAYLRQSYNFNISLQQTVNKRMVLAILPGISYQHGLLSTPYHRVYFIDGSERVENLPPDRWKIPLGIQLNSFIGDRYIIRGYYRFYWDDFGIIANTISLDVGIRLLPQLTLTPSVRLYTQTAARYFRPYGKADSAQTYYTSDYDLSAFNAIELALEANLAAIDKSMHRIDFSNVSLRYSFYKRTDGLYAHMISTIFNLNAYKESQKNKFDGGF
ncbi:MAG: DUF3570 domain-containing protein [Chitinophagales bacterium]